MISRRGTDAGFHRYAVGPTLLTVPVQEASTIMLFGKRERAIKRILVVEDEPLVAFENEHQLQAAGFEVAGTVDTVEEARRIMEEEEEVDLVLLDIGLTDGSGIEVARLAEEKGINVLFVTGDCPEEHKHLAVGCLSKPYSDRVLKGAIDAVDTLARGDKLKKVPDQLILFTDDVSVSS